MNSTQKLDVALNKTNQTRNNKHQKVEPHLKHLFWHCEFFRHLFRYLFRSFFRNDHFLHILKRFFAHVGAFFCTCRRFFEHVGVCFCTFGVFVCTFRCVFCTICYFFKEHEQKVHRHVQTKCPNILFEFVFFSTPFGEMIHANMPKELRNCKIK